MTSPWRFVLGLIGAVGLGAVALSLSTAASEGGQIDVWQVVPVTLVGLLAGGLVGRLAGIAVEHGEEGRWTPTRLGGIALVIVVAILLIVSTWKH